ncbi:MAG: acetyl-CoA C-acyltransferase, partial [SAR324 cluster bacterium]
VTIPQRRGAALIADQDEHLRQTSLEKLSQLRTIFGGESTVTAGNASGLNDGAAAIILASEAAIKRYGLQPQARVLGMDVAGVAPRIMGIGPVNATNKLFKRLNLSMDQMDIIELNEAFAAQALACSRELGLADNDPRINPQGGAIALGHPLGMSGARLIISAVRQLQRTGGKRALCSMCVGVGQGISVVLEKV